MEARLSFKTSLSLSLLAAAGFACNSGSTSSSEDCVGAKCDTPGQTADEVCANQCGGDSDCVDECRTDFGVQHCEARRADAVESSQTAFIDNAIRWACADVEGVNANGNDDRGQEYCEYFAIVQLPPEADGDSAPDPVKLGTDGNFGVELTQDQIFSLEDEPDAVVGQCLFTSWHSDIDSELPICGKGSCTEVAIGDSDEQPSWMEDRGLAFQLNRDLAQMTGSINSNGAAVDLVNRCITTQPNPPEDIAEDDYMRGCWGAFELFGTEWRRSDPSICVASMRLGECGCALDTNGDNVADITDPLEIASALVPAPSGSDVPLRGFPLGTWSGGDELPAGCRFLETGDTSQTVVGCALTATDLLTSAADPKDRCREKYGSNVVVHVPVPSELVLCQPPEDGEFTGTCGELVPFAAPDEIQAGECCRTCGATSKPCGDSCIPLANTCNQPAGCACDG